MHGRTSKMRHLGEQLFNGSSFKFLFGNDQIKGCFFFSDSININSYIVKRSTLWSIIFSFFFIYITSEYLIDRKSELFPSAITNHSQLHVTELSTKKLCLFWCSCIYPPSIGSLGLFSASAMKRQMSRLTEIQSHIQLFHFTRSQIEWKALRYYSSTQLAFRARLTHSHKSALHCLRTPPSPLVILFLTTWHIPPPCVYHWQVHVLPAALACRDAIVTS